jgi:ureidoglycolate lyase
MTSTQDRIIAQAVPLESDAFAPYGTIIQCQDTADRQYHPEAFEYEHGVANPTMWLRRLTNKTELPLTISSLERHPFSAQAFIPLKNFSNLVVVCDATSDGLPDLETLHAFIAGHGQGVCYRRNVWHHGFTILDDAAEVITVMSQTGRGDDDVFVSLPRVVEIHATQGDLNG